jgi:hypothetical protein
MWKTVWWTQVQMLLLKLPLLLCSLHLVRFFYVAYLISRQIRRNSKQNWLLQKCIRNILDITNMQRHEPNNKEQHDVLYCVQGRYKEQKKERPTNVASFSFILQSPLFLKPEREKRNKILKKRCCNKTRPTRETWVPEVQQLHTKCTIIP